MLPVLIIAIFLFLAMLGAVIWTAAGNPFVIKRQLVETNISTVVKEILPVSNFVCMIYNYQSINQRSYNPGSWLRERNILIVIDGTINLGFNCEEIIVQESESRLVLFMPPIKVLSHEQYPERARTYDLAGGIFPVSVRPQEILDLLGDSKLEQQGLAEANEELMKHARDSAESMFRPLLELSPSIRDQFTVVFQW